MHSSRIKCTSGSGYVRFVDPVTMRVYNSAGLEVNRDVTWNSVVQGWASSGGMLYTPCVEPPVPTPGPKSDGEVSANERGAGLKFDGSKGRWSLLMGGMSKALTGVVAVLTFGAKKYAAHNWKQVENNKERYRDALYRHLNAIESGELVDPESGLPHWDHVACNALFLSELDKEEPGGRIDNIRVTTHRSKDLEGKSNEQP